MQLTVVGGGLTCLVAAIKGAELGWCVTVHEARSTLGGTTTSRSWSSTSPQAGPDTWRWRHVAPRRPIVILSRPHHAGLP